MVVALSMDLNLDACSATKECNNELFILVLILILDIFSINKSFGSGHHQILLLLLLLSGSRFIMIGIWLKKDFDIEKTILTEL